MLRGGAWLNVDVNARAASRSDNHPVNRSNHNGFRLAAAFASPISI